MPAPDHAWNLPALLELGRALQNAGYRFTTVTPATHARVLARRPGAMARSLRDVFGWSLPYRPGPASFDGNAPPGLPALIERSGIAMAAGDGALRSALRCSTLDGLLCFHSAYPTSDANAVFFGPDTYRFIRALRQEAALRNLEDRPAPRRIADLCCGAGPAAVVLAGLYPQAEVLAIDINRDALALTVVNAALAGVSNVSALYSDLFNEVQAEFQGNDSAGNTYAGNAGGFDLVVANPPYLLDAGQRSYRHGGGELGEALALRIVEAALEHLNPGGTLMLYTGVAMVDGQDVLYRRAAPLLEAAGCTWRYEEIDPDVFGEELAEPAYQQAERIAAVWLTATKLPAKAPAKPPAKQRNQ